LPALLPGLKRLFCGLDSHHGCGCGFDDPFSKNAIKRTEEEAAEHDRAGWVATCAEVEETCKIVRGMGCLAVKVRLELLSWYHSPEHGMTDERERWMIAELEEAFVAGKRAGEDESAGDGDGAVRDDPERASRS
jgi:hypothetical protein